MLGVPYAEHFFLIFYYIRFATSIQISLARIHTFDFYFSNIHSLIHYPPDCKIVSTSKIIQ